MQLISQYTSEELRAQPLLAAIVSLLYGFASTCVVGPIALIAGAHGNFPLLWVYLNGPVAWVARLAANTQYIFWIIGIATLCVWTAYWAFIFIGPTLLSREGRKWIVFGFHLVCGGAIQLVFGLP